VSIARVTRAALLAAAVTAIALPAHAQAPNGPFARLFGGPTAREAREWTSLDFRGAGGGEFSNFFFSDPAAIDEAGRAVESRTDRPAATASAGVMFVRHRTTSELVIDGGSVFREYFDTASPYGATSLNAGARYRAEPVTRVTFESTASFDHQPFFYMVPQSLSATPDWIIDVPMTPQGVFMQANDSLYGKAGIEYRAAKRTSLQASVNGQKVRFPDVRSRDYTTLGGLGVLRHKLTRDLGLHFGYGREDYRVRREDRQFTREYLDIGVDYGREISIARRTMIRFATMTGIVREGEGPRRFRFEGFLSMVKDFNRSWHAELTAQRRTEFLPGFFEPMFSDTATLMFGGMLAPRLQWAVAGGGGKGRVGLDGDATFNTATAASRLSVGLSRRLGTFVHYAYFYYDASPGSSIGLGPLSGSSRHSVIVGLNVWVPIYDRIRMPRDPE
jgi:hypothetical protein